MATGDEAAETGRPLTRTTFAGGRVKISRQALSSWLRQIDDLKRNGQGDDRERSGATLYFDTTLPGFGVRISAGGVIAYFAQGRIGGLGRASPTRRVTIGRHPLFSPEAARKEAQRILSEMATGSAPKSKAERVLVSDALDRWMREHVAMLKPRTQFDYRRIVEMELRPALGKLLVSEVRRSDIVDLHQGKSKTPRLANYVVAAARSFFSFCEVCELRPHDSNPARRIRLYREAKRERFLSEEEIGRAADAILIAEASGSLSPYAAAALRLAMLTGARQGELAALRWAEVDFERRMLRLSDSKTGPKPVWLSEPAMEILRSIPKTDGNPFVFVGGKDGDHFRTLSHVWIRIRGAVGLDDVRLHDLRHSHASVAAGQGHSLPVIGKLLGHSVPQTTARYAHLANDPVATAAEEVGRAIGDLMQKGRADGSI